MIINTPLQGIVARQKELRFLAGESKVHEIIEWKTQEHWAEELELLIYPLAPSESPPGHGSDTWPSVAFELQITQGAPKSGKIWETTAPIPNGGGKSASYLFVPSCGVRLRFACTAARLRGMSSSAAVACSVFASFTPCSGSPVQVVPDRVPFPNPNYSFALGDSVFLGQPIPKGAREARVCLIGSHRFDRLVLQDINNAAIQTLGGGALGEPGATWSDWRPIPGAAHYAALVSADQIYQGAGEILYR